MTIAHAAITATWIVALALCLRVIWNDIRSLFPSGDETANLETDNVD